MDKVKLKVPPGTSMVNHGGETYKVVDGFVEVPREVADALMLSHHGFAEVKKVQVPQK